MQSTKHCCCHYKFITDANSSFNFIFMNSVTHFSIAWYVFLIIKLNQAKQTLKMKLCVCWWVITSKYISNDESAIVRCSICDWTNILPTIYTQRNVYLVNFRSRHSFVFIIACIMTRKKILSWIYLILMFIILSYLRKLTLYDRWWMVV